MLLGSKREHTRISLVFLDLLVTVLAFALAFFIRSFLVIDNNSFLVDIQYYALLFILILLVWTILLSGSREVQILPNKSFKEIAYDVTKIVFVGTILILSITFLIKGFIISRIFILLFSAINVIFLVAERKLYQFYKISKFRSNKGLSDIVIIGRGAAFKQITQLIRSHRDWGITLANEYDIDGFDKKTADKIKSMPIDLVIFAGEKKDSEKIEEYLNLFAESGIKTMVNIDTIFNVKKNNFVSTQTVFGFDFLEFSDTNEKPMPIYLKYFFDKIFSLILIILMMPIYLLVTLLILVFMGRPILFIQERVGMNGKAFKMIKFRTMVKGAEEMKEKLVEKNEMSGPVFKIVEDPRVTRLGRFLRKYSLDEIPQFLNILKGEMSFVGPRPPLLSEVKEYEFWHRRRLSMKPGLTCLWQISGRNEIDFTDWMYKDMEYIDKWSLIYDFAIVVKTIPIVLKGGGI
ncbi:MAG: sugar transferase [bacterium]